MCASWCCQPNWFLMPLWEKSCPVYFFCIARIQKKVLTVSELLQFTSSTVLCFLFVCSTDKRCKMFSGDLRLLLVIRQNGSKKETLSNKATEQFNRQCHNSVFVTDKNHTIKTSRQCWFLLSALTTTIPDPQPLWQLPDQFLCFLLSLPQSQCLCLSMSTFLPMKPLKNDDFHWHLTFPPFKIQF